MEANRYMKFIVVY